MTAADGGQKRTTITAGWRSYTYPRFGDSLHNVAAHQQTTWPAPGNLLVRLGWPTGFVGRLLSG